VRFQTAPPHAPIPTAVTRAAIPASTLFSVTSPFQDPSNDFSSRAAFHLSRLRGHLPRMLRRNACSSPEPVGRPRHDSLLLFTSNTAVSRNEACGPYAIVHRLRQQERINPDGEQLRIEAFSGLRGGARFVGRPSSSCARRTNGPRARAGEGFPAGSIGVRCSAPTLGLSDQSIFNLRKAAKRVPSGSADAFRCRHPTCPSGRINSAPSGSISQAA